MSDWTPLWLSLRVATTATLAAAVVGIAVAYWLAKGRFRGRGVIEAIVTAPMVLPPTVLGYYLLTLLGDNSPIGRTWTRLTGEPLVFTSTAAVVAAAVSALPLVVRAARAAIEDVDPRIEEALRVAGHSEWRVARFATLPAARRGVLAGVALGFARALGDFGSTVMVAGNIPGSTQTLPIAIYDAVQVGDSGRAGSAATVLTAIAIVVLLVLSQLSGRRR